jgi:hypothetical protein
MTDINAVLQAYEALVFPTADSTLYTADSTDIRVDTAFVFGDIAAFSSGTAVAVFGALATAEGVADSANFIGKAELVEGALAAQEAADSAAFIGLAIPVLVGVLAAQEAADVAAFRGAAYYPADWEESEGLKDEVSPTVWLQNLGGRETWLTNEVQGTVWLQNLNPRVVYLDAEQARITWLEGLGAHAGTTARSPRIQPRKRSVGVECCVQSAARSGADYQDYVKQRYGEFAWLQT